MRVRTGVGQDSQRFISADVSKPCVIGGLIFDGVPGLASNSDGDVLFHALCNALSSLTGVVIIGGLADELCFKQGITDSSVYVEKGLECLGGQKITHVAISLEGKRPRFAERLQEMRTHIAKVLKVDVSQVGITATSGEGLTHFGCGDGVQAFCIITTEEG